MNECLTDVHDRPSKDRMLFALQTNSICEISQTLANCYSITCEHVMVQALNELPCITYTSTCKIGVTVSHDRRHQLTKEGLARKWNIGLSQAEHALKVTTQSGIRSAVHPEHRRFRTKQSQLHYKQLGTRHGRLYSDTMLSNVKSTQESICG